MEHAALDVYHWGAASQDRLLGECLGPAVRALREEGVVRRFWFHRFNARGPHLFVLIGMPPGRAEEALRRLGGALEAYLAAHPSPVALSPPELEALHAQCRGRSLSATDREPGFGANNSLRVAPHPAGAYLLRETAALGDGEDEAWDLMTELALWTTGEVRAGRGEAGAVAWIAAVDAALRRAGAPAEAHWRFYVTTLLHGLEERLEHAETEITRRLWEGLGPENRALFAAAWRRAADGAPVWPGVDRLAALLDGGEGRPAPERWRLLRETNHAVLAQLGMEVPLRVPLAIYAWLHGAAPR